MFEYLNDAASKEWGSIDRLWSGIGPQIPST